jgi:hypothetical protein
VLVEHRHERQENADRQRQDGDERAPRVEQEDEDDDADDDHLLDERVLERRDRFFDELRPVVGGDDLDTLGQTRLDLAEPLLDRVDHRQRVLAVAHDHDAAGRLAFAVELREAAADVRADADSRHVLGRESGCRSTTLMGLLPISGVFT